MSARSNSPEDKAAAPALENKSLAPAAVEDKVAVVFAHPLPAGRVDGKDHAVGSKATFDAGTARHLVREGAARYAD